MLLKGFSPGAKQYEPTVIEICCFALALVTKLDKLKLNG